MRFFEFLHPDKIPQNAQMPKRLNTLKRKKRQTTHTPHPHHKIPPKFRQNHDCTLQVSLVHRCQVSAYPTKHPEVSQCAKIQGFGLPKRLSKFPPTQQSTPKFHHALKSEVSDYLKRPSKFHARGSARRDCRTTERAVLKNHINLNRRITAGVNDFPRLHFLDCSVHVYYSLTGKLWRSLPSSDSKVKLGASLSSVALSAS